MINLIVSVDQNYLDKAETMIFSLCHNTKEKVTVYLLNASLSEDMIKNFSYEMRRRCKAQVVPVKVPEQIFGNMPLDVEGRHLSVEMYSRILAPYLLPENIDRVLWLDADIIVNGNISEFYHQHLDGQVIAACKDNADDWDSFQEHKRKLGLPDSHVYFNSGVILMDLAAIRKLYEIKDIINICQRLKECIIYPDQDLLNVLYAGRIKYQDPQRYNRYGASLVCSGKEMKNIVIIHYYGRVKPWEEGHISIASRPYLHYLFLRGKRKQALTMGFHAVDRPLWFYFFVVKPVIGEKNHERLRKILKHGKTGENKK